MWLDKIDPVAPPPRKYAGMMQSFAEANPEFQRVLWNGRTVRRLMEERRLDRELQFFNQLPRVMHQCDFARSVVLVAHGGIYSDLDFICRKNLLPLIEGKETYFTTEPVEHGEKIVSGFMACAASHPFLEGWLEYLMASFDPQADPVISTGPSGLHRYWSSLPAWQRPRLEDYCEVVPLATEKGRWYVSSKCRNSPAPYVYTRWIDGTEWYKDHELRGARRAWTRGLSKVRKMFAGLVLPGPRSAPACKPLGPKHDFPPDE